jgi:hypothetical protein
LNPPEAALWPGIDSIDFGSWQITLLKRDKEFSTAAMYAYIFRTKKVAEKDKILGN